MEGGGLYLNTQNYTIIDNVRLINVLIIKFNCKCSIHILYPLLKPFFTTDMLYKLRKN